MEIDNKRICAIAFSNTRSQSIALGVPQYPLARSRVPHELPIRELADRDRTVYPIVDDPRAILGYLDTDRETLGARELGILPLELILARFETVRWHAGYLRGLPQAKHRSNCAGFGSTQLWQDHKPCSAVFEYTVRISSSARAR